MTNPVNSDDGKSANVSRHYSIGLGYTIGLSFGVLLLINLTILTFCFCARKKSPADRQNSQRGSTGSTTDQDDIAAATELGLNESTVLTYPKFLYSEIKIKLLENGGSSTVCCCSICLDDYKETDMVRLLPDCGHFFHLQCVDSWLRLHCTCPTCRSLPVPQLS